VMSCPKWRSTSAHSRPRFSSSFSLTRSAGRARR
jgi:hypothetical protein